MKIKGPGIFSIVFISMIEGIYVLGVSYFISNHRNQKLTDVFDNAQYAVYGLFICLNYLLVYKRAKQYEYYSKMLNPFIVVALLVLAYLIMGIGGDMYRDKFSVTK